MDSDEELARHLQEEEFMAGLSQQQHSNPPSQATPEPQTRLLNPTVPSNASSDTPSVSPQGAMDFFRQLFSGPLLNFRGLMNPTSVPPSLHPTLPRNQAVIGQEKLLKRQELKIRAERKVAETFQRFQPMVLGAEDLSTQEECRRLMMEGGVLDGAHRRWSAYLAAVKTVGRWGCTTPELVEDGEVKGEVKGEIEGEEGDVDFIKATEALDLLRKYADGPFSNGGGGGGGGTHVARFERESESDSLGVSMGLEDFFVVELLDWFKHRFFRWVNEPACHSCSAKTKFEGSVAPSTDDLGGGAQRVELYRCTACGCAVRFPRYNFVPRLLAADHRRGRCGEWANTFLSLLRSAGFEARFVADNRDHVWTEYFSVVRQRWIALDPCENAYDTPLMYEQGWGKQVDLVFGISVYGIYDVTSRYTRKWGAVRESRQREGLSDSALCMAAMELTRKLREQWMTKQKQRRRCEVMTKGREEKEGEEVNKGEVNKSEESKGEEKDITLFSNGNELDSKFKTLLLDVELETSRKRIRSLPLMHQRGGLAVNLDLKYDLDPLLNPGLSPVHVEDPHWDDEKVLVEMVMREVVEVFELRANMKCGGARFTPAAISHLQHVIDSEVEAAAAAVSIHPVAAAVARGVQLLTKGFTENLANSKCLSSKSNDDDQGSKHKKSEKSEKSEKSQKSVTAPKVRTEVYGGRESGSEEWKKARNELGNRILGAESNRKLNEQNSKGEDDLKEGEEEE